MRALKHYRWAFPLLTVTGLWWASAATLPIASSDLSGGGSVVPVCDSSTPLAVQNVGAGTSNVVSVDVAGILAACAGGTVKVTVGNGTDPAQEATRTIPSGGGTVNVPLGIAVPLKEVHLVAVDLRGP
jgi:hypothetical protein